MVGRDLSARLIDAGAQLLRMTDALAMQAQGAMWVFDHSLDEWRYYLVTSLVDTLGRRKTYKLLIDAFEHLGTPSAITLYDVHLGSPKDSFFAWVSGVVGFDDSVVRFTNSVFGGTAFDAVVYRAVRHVPEQREAERIEKDFSKRIMDLARAA